MKMYKVYAGSATFTVETVNPDKGESIETLLYDLQDCGFMTATVELPYNEFMTTPGESAEGKVDGKLRGGHVVHRFEDGSVIFRFCGKRRDQSKAQTNLVHLRHGNFHIHDSGSEGKQ